MFVPRRCGPSEDELEAHKIDGDLLAQTGLEDVTNDVVVLGDQFLFGVDSELVAVRTCGDRITGCASPPVILVSDSAVAPVLVTFDEVRRFGILPMLALLRPAQRREVHVLSVDKSDERAAATAERASTLLRRSMQHSIRRYTAGMVTVMVITCPHALGLAVAPVVAVSTSLSAGSGHLSETAPPLRGHET